MGPISTIGSRCKAGHPNYWTQIEVVFVLFLAPHPHKLSLFLLKIPLSWSPLVTKILSPLLDSHLLQKFYYLFWIE